VLANTTFEGAVEKILEERYDLPQRLRELAFLYRVVGGFAIFLHIDPVDPMAARLTKDVDVAIDRRDVDAIRMALMPYGFTDRHVAGVDMFLDANYPGARSVQDLDGVGLITPEIEESLSEPLRRRLAEVRATE